MAATPNSFPGQNICHQLCPYSEIKGVEARETTDLTDGNGNVAGGFLGMLGALARDPAGVLQRAQEGLAHEGYRTNVCPSRGKTPETWVPSEHCRHSALEVAEELQPFDGTLNRREAENMARIGLGQDLLPAANPWENLPPEPSVAPEA